MKNLFLSILLLTFGIFYGQSERKVGDFSSVKVYDRISVEMIKSNQNKVEIFGDDDDMVEIVNSNGDLKIRTKPIKLLQGNRINVKVYYTQIKSIQASQGANISSKNEIEAKRLSITSNEGSNIHLTIDVDILEVKANSGGEIILSGDAKMQDIVVNSGASFVGRNIDSDNATVAANAGGKAQVYAEESIKATVRAGGNIEIYGNPKYKDTKKVVGGTITFK